MSAVGFLGHGKVLYLFGNIIGTLVVAILLFLPLGLGLSLALRFLYSNYLFVILS